MKKTILLILFLFIGVVSSNAQESRFYEKYGDEKGMTSVYMPLGWLSKTGVLSRVTAEVDEVDLSPIIENLSLMIVLNTEKSAIIDKLTNEVNQASKDKSYQLMFQVKDDGETISGYIHSKDNKQVDELLLFVKDESEASLIQLFGDMTMEDIKKVASSADL